jgi:type I restriction enzyme S subunit
MTVEEYPFSELLSVVIDNRGKTCPTADSGIPLIATNCIRNEQLYPTYDKVRFVSHEAYSNWFRGHPLPGDIIFVNKATPGRVCLVPDPVDFCIAQDMVAVRANPKRVYPNYLFAVLRSPAVQEKISQMHVGTLIPHFKKGDFDKLLLPVPERNIQEFIGDTYFTLSAKIELNRRMNATLEAMARALFQSWFVDFDPVRAKLDGRQPLGMDEATAALFPDSFQDSPLGHIPKGWEICSLAKKIELLSGGTPKTSEPSYWDGDIPWYSVKDAPSETDVWVIQTEKCVTKMGIKNSAAQILPKGTTIISARGTVGRLALVGNPMAMNQSCYGVRSAKGYGDFFTYFALRQSTTSLQQRTHGTVFDTITRQTFETFDCIFPPENLTQNFDRAVSPLLTQIHANLHHSHTLATLRDTLLPKLLSGEIQPTSNLIGN